MFVPGSDNYQWNKVKCELQNQAEKGTPDRSASLMYGMEARLDLLKGLIESESSLQHPRKLSKDCQVVGEDFEGSIPDAFEDSPAYWAKKMPGGYLQTISTSTLVQRFAAQHTANGGRIALVYGADNFVYMTAWNNIQNIFQSSDLLIFLRGEVQFKSASSRIMDMFARILVEVDPESSGAVKEVDGSVLFGDKQGHFEVEDSKGKSTLCVLPALAELESCSSTKLRGDLMERINGHPGNSELMALHGYAKEEQVALLVNEGSRVLEQTDAILSEIEQKGVEKGQLVSDEDDDPASKKPKM